MVHVTNLTPGSANRIRRRRGRDGDGRGGSGRDGQQGVGRQPVADVADGQHKKYGLAAVFVLHLVKINAAKIIKVVLTVALAPRPPSREYLHPRLYFLRRHSPSRSPQGSQQWVKRCQKRNAKEDAHAPRPSPAVACCSRNRERGTKNRLAESRAAK
jgi:hypothetical protein